MKQKTLKRVESAPGEAYSATWGRKFRLGKIGRGNLSNIRFWAGEEYSISRPKLPPCQGAHRYTGVNA